MDAATAARPVRAVIVRPGAYDVPMTDTTQVSDLERLARPFADRLVRTRPQGSITIAYVNHADTAAKLLAICGPFDMDVDQVTENVWKVTVTADIDGRATTVSDVCTDANAEAAVSRAFCRAVSRFGLGLHLWAGSDELYLQLEHARTGARPQATVSQFDPDDDDQADNYIANRAAVADMMAEGGSEPWQD